jgi:hypothetical protein
MIGHPVLLLQACFEPSRLFLGLVPTLRANYSGLDLQLMPPLVKRWAGYGTIDARNMQRSNGTLRQGNGMC